MRLKEFFARRRAAVIVAAVVLPVGVSGWFAVATSAAAITKVAPQSVSSAFREAQSADDKLPDFLVSGPQKLDGVQSETARRLGESNGVDYWLAMSTVKDFCLIVLLPGEDEFAAMTCQNGARVLEHGIGMQVADATHAIRAYVVPEGYVVRLPEYTRVGNQLLIGNALQEAAKLKVGKTISGGDGPANIYLPDFQPVDPTEIG